jgi:hypothetical protein
MANQTAAKSKRPRRRRRSAASPTAEQIVSQIVKALTEAITNAGLSLSVGALDEWQPKLLQSVKDNLKAGGLWTPIAQKNVLRVAADMGRIAVILSADDAEVTKSRVHAAFRAAQFHKTCPGAGGGAWCNFRI